MVCLPETDREKELETAAGGPQPNPAEDRPEDEGCGPAEESPEDEMRGLAEKLPEDEGCGPEEKSPEDEMSGPAEELPGPHSGFGSGFLAGVLTMALVVCVFALGWITAQKSSLARRRQESADLGAEVLTDSDTLHKLDEIQGLIKENYIGEVDSELLSTCLFKGLAVGLDDVYADYYSPSELEDIMDSSRGEYRGIGVTLSQDVLADEIRVDEVYAGGPAEQQGLRPGDVLLEVDDEPLSGKQLSEAVSLIKSKEDEFSLKVFRPETQEELVIALECGDVELVDVSAEMKTEEIGYIKLTEFTQAAVGQFSDAVQELEKQGMKKLIVDLRDNPGGLLNSVCDILDEILPEGLIVYTEDRDGRRGERTSDGERSVTCEVAVLVNGGSASAAEIFAGAVQDYELGPVIGTQTYGKGVVQDTYMLSDGSAIKMTTEKYFTPKGQDIDGSGITPDIVVEEEPESSGDDAGAEDAGVSGDGMEPGDAGISGDGTGPEDVGAVSAGEMQEDGADPVLEAALDALAGG